MFTCGIPLFLLEVSIGQYLGVGGMSVIGQICPIFKGVGYSAIAMVFLECVYYVIIVAWTMFYILNLLYNIGNGLPWDDCAKGSTYIQIEARRAEIIFKTNFLIFRRNLGWHRLL